MTNLHPIKTADEHRTALIRIDQLMGAAEGSEEAAELEVLAILVERYEREAFPIDPPCVTIQENEQTDPVVDAFLAFLEKDMIENPNRLTAFPAGLLEKARELTAGIAINLDEPLE